MLLPVAQNDRTTASITTLAEILKRRGVAHCAIIDKPFLAQAGSGGTPAGHRVFSAQGLDVWQKDVFDFPDRYLRPASTGMSGGTNSSNPAWSEP
jgi:hypothetical protein